MPQYPGLGLALRHRPQDNDDFYPIGAHSSCISSGSDVLSVRELAMMDVMDKLTDKEDWARKVFDEEIVAKWRREALEIADEEFTKLATRDKYQKWDDSGNFTIHHDDVYRPNERGLEGIMDADTFNVCVKELQAKAEYFEKTKLIPTLDAWASVTKSDSLVTPELQASLCAAFSELMKDNASVPDWHPNSGDMVRDLVHPSMYPLVYGRSRVLEEEVVGIRDAIEKWAGKGDIISDDHGHEKYRFDDIPPKYWSNKYQWLPADVAFQDDGSVKFTSYVNNLHPTKHRGIYRTIEKLIETAIPAWDQCLAVAADYGETEGAGRLSSRFSFLNRAADDENLGNWTPLPHEVGDDDIDPEELKEAIMDAGYYPEDCEEHVMQDIKWKVVRRPCIPEASYKEVDYTPASGTRLVDRFRKSGLQVIVKIASIELTPDRPAFPVGGWHIEGQMNEHICGTALYYLDSDNVTSSNLSFRMQTSADLHENIYLGQDSYHWLEHICGTKLGAACYSPCLQNYGSVETRQGRLLAFPNVFQHRVSPFRLIDPSKPGHRRFVALWLVDPNIRIISTANVPPQRQSWWADAVFGKSDESRLKAVSKLPPEILELLQGKGFDSSLSTNINGKLPPELMDMVRYHFNADGDTIPMTSEEAQKHRLELMQERSAFVKTAGAGWQREAYNFCEH